MPDVPPTDPGPPEEPAFRVSTALAYGLRATLAHWQPLVIISLIVFAAQGLLQWWVGRPTDDPLSVLTTLAVYLVGLVASLGLMRAALRITDGRRHQLHQVLDRAAGIREHVQARVDACSLPVEPCLCRVSDVPARTKINLRHPEEALFHALVRYAAPVLVFTAEEVWGTRFPDGGSVHLLEWPDLSASSAEVDHGSRFTPAPFRG